MQPVFLFFLSTTESEQGVAQAILRGIIDFKREPWPNISETAKNLVRQMLEPDPKRRLTAKQVLGTQNPPLTLLLVPASVTILIPNFDIISHFVEHPWIQNAKKAPNVPLGDVVKSRLKQFSVMNRFKRKALRVS